MSVIEIEDTSMSVIEIEDTSMSVGERGEIKLSSFDRKTVEAQKAAKNEKWENFKDIFRKEDKAKLLQPFDLFGNTAIHAVARSGSPRLLRELLEMLPEQKKNEALKKQNLEGNTLLHEAVLHKDVEMASAIIQFDPNGWKGELLLQTNRRGQTPLTRAARYGKLDMIKHTAKHVPLQSKHFTSNPKLPILHDCVLGLHFEVAVWLAAKVDGILTDQYWDEKRLTCLHLLLKMPNAFKSKATLQMGTTQQLIYNLLPERYELFDIDGSSMLLGSTKDTESGQPDDETENPPKTTISRMSIAFWKPLEEVISKINYVFWKLLSKGCGGINEIWEQKKEHKFAEHLASWLVKNDQTWLEIKSYNEDLSPPINVSPQLPSNVTEEKKEVELRAKMKKKHKIKEQMKQKDLEELQKKHRIKEQMKQECLEEQHKNEAYDDSNYTPLFFAAASGIIEVVKKFIDKSPEAISHVNKDGLNILHVAVKHRQLDIFEYIENSAAFESLASRITGVEGGSRTILHQAASMEYYREQVLPGVAYQLQDELIWYDRVKKIVPRHYLMHCDSEGLTPGDLLDIEHAEMHDQAKVWMKETAQSCSTVAVLIAGVVFAAAYAIPGGNERGTPVFHHSPAFRFFTAMDVVALACSLGSVVMFLSILTSSFDLWDFHKSLPRKLKLGFLMLFFSLISTMLAFAATILLTIRMEGNKKRTTFVYSLAFIIVSIFGLTQFPLYKMLEDHVKQCLELWKTLKVKLGGKKNKKLITQKV